MAVLAVKVEQREFSFFHYPAHKRLDHVRTRDDEFALVELELIEPSMYLREAEHAPRMFAEAIDSWLQN